MAKAPNMSDLSNTGGVQVAGQAGGKGETAAPPKKKAAAKKKVAAKSTTTAKAGVTDKTDLIAVTVAEVENLTEAKCKSETLRLIKAQGEDQLRLGALFFAISEKEHWSKWGYESFKDCVHGEFGLVYRSAAYLVQIYTTLVDADIPWSEVSHLGWTKLRMICPFLKSGDKEIVAKWIQIAGSGTVAALEQSIKDERAAGGSGEVTSGGADVVNWVLKLHPDQRDDIKAALDACKTEFSTEFDSVALHHMAGAYMGGAGKGKVSVPAVLKKLGTEKLIEEAKKALDVDLVDASHILEEGAEVPSLKALMEQSGDIGAVLNLVEEVWPDADIKVEMP